MKRKILVPAVLAVSMLMPCTSFAASEWYVDKTVVVREDTELTMENAPTVTISADSMFKEDFSFELDITNAEWLYDNTGILETGLEYIKLGDSEILFNVDYDEYKPDVNDIVIPLYCKITKGTAEVVLVCDDYNIKDGNDKSFGKTPEESKTTVSYGGNAGNLGGNKDELEDISIKEHDLDEIKKGDKYILTLTNSFEFTGDGKVSGTGSFENANMDISFEKPDVCVITVNDNLKNVSGSILVTGLKVNSTTDSAFKGTDIVVTKSADKNCSETVNIGKLIQTVPSDAPLKVAVVTMDNGSISASGTGAPGKKIRIVAGGKTVAETRTDVNGEWSVTEKFDETLEEGLYHVEIGYYSASTDKFTSVITSDIKVSSPMYTVSFVMGEKSMTVNGVKTDIDGRLFIDENGRMMVPVRALANALGVDNNNIVWNDSLKAVTLKAGNTTVETRIGSDIITVNGKDTKIDTKAVIKDERTYLPLRAVAEALGAENIEWNDASKTAFVTVKK